MDDKRFCGCKCHPPTSYMEVCRECCVRAAKDGAFETMMKQNETVLKLQAEKDALLLQIETLKKEKADEVLRSRYWEERWFSQGAELGTANRLLNEQQKIVEAARTLVEAEKQRGEMPFQMDCLLAALRTAVDGCAENRKYLCDCVGGNLDEPSHFPDCATWKNESK